MDKSKLFKFGLVIRLLLIIFCVPHIQKIWFLEFINNSLENLSFNPWQAHLNAGGDIKAFPYGYIMYLFYLPLTTLGWLFDKLLNLEYFSRFGFAITTLIFDYGILLGIIRLLKNYSSKLILIAYWCSPVIFYIFYWHGQIDALPVFFLIYGLSLLQKEKTNLAGIFLGLAISSKFSMLAAIPFIFIYLIRNKRLKNKGWRYQEDKTGSMMLKIYKDCEIDFLDQKRFPTKEKGKHNNIFNVPLPAGTTSEKYMNALDRVLDKLVEFKPEFLILSMGFDANIADPLAQFELKSEDFYEITKRTLKATNEFTNGKVVSVLEGGYDLNALADSAFNHVNALVENN